MTDTGREHVQLPTSGRQGQAAFVPACLVLVAVVLVPLPVVVGFAVWVVAMIVALRAVASTRALGPTVVLASGYPVQTGTVLAVIWSGMLPSTVDLLVLSAVVVVAQVVAAVVAFRRWGRPS